MELGFRIKKFIHYQWKAKTKYYLHSPFIYQFYLNVLEGDTGGHLDALLRLRQQLKTSNQTVTITDWGTGQNRQVAIKRLEQQVAIPHHYGKVLYRLAAYFKPSTILELGTSIGLSSAYLALGVNNSQLITLEGSTEIAEVAGRNHAGLGLQNIEMITGDFKNTLPATLNKVDSVDLVFFDGNHRKDATIQYFELCLQKATENSVFVFDDIYWSSEMYEAWNEIKSHPRVTISIDIYKMGLCFFKKEKLAPEHFMLRA